MANNNISFVSCQLFIVLQAKKKDFDQRACSVNADAKCEFINPDGSVKDRIALRMVREAAERGLFRPGSSTIVEATPGNTDMVALIAAAKDYQCIFTVSSNMSTEKVPLQLIFSYSIKWKPKRQQSKFSNDSLTRCPCQTVLC